MSLGRSDGFGEVDELHRTGVDVCLRKVLRLVKLRYFRIVHNFFHVREFLIDIPTLFDSLKYIILNLKNPLKSYTGILFQLNVTSY